MQTMALQGSGTAVAASGSGRVPAHGVEAASFREALRHVSGEGMKGAGGVVVAPGGSAAKNGACRHADKDSAATAPMRRELPVADNTGAARSQAAEPAGERVGSFEGSGGAVSAAAALEVPVDELRAESGPGRANEAKLKVGDATADTGNLRKAGSAAGVAAGRSGIERPAVCVVELPGAVSGTATSSTGVAGGPAVARDQATEATQAIDLGLGGTVVSALAVWRPGGAAGGGSERIETGDGGEVAGPAARDKSMREVGRGGKTGQVAAPPGRMEDHATAAPLGDAVSAGIVEKTSARHVGSCPDGTSVGVGIGTAGREVHGIAGERKFDGPAPAADMGRVSIERGLDGGAASGPGRASQSGLVPEHRLLSGTVNTLEVGMASAGSGWLTIRAEKTDAGISASLVAGSAERAQGLRHELPAMSAFLATERIAMGSLVVQHAGGAAGREHGSSRGGGISSAGGEAGSRGEAQGGEAGRRESTTGSSTGSSQGSPLAVARQAAMDRLSAAVGGSAGVDRRNGGIFYGMMLPQRSPGSGGWLSVMA